MLSHYKIVSAVAGLIVGIVISVFISIFDLASQQSDLLSLSLLMIWLVLIVVVVFFCLKNSIPEKLLASSLVFVKATSASLFCALVSFIFVFFYLERFPAQDEYMLIPILLIAGPIAVVAKYLYSEFFAKVSH